MLLDNSGEECVVDGDDNDGGAVAGTDETALIFWLRRLNNVDAGGKLAAGEAAPVICCGWLSEAGRLTIDGRFEHIQRNLSQPEHKSFSN